jgi:hypothetical protein
VPHGQEFNVWSLSNQNAGAPDGTLKYMDGPGINNKHGVSPFVDRGGYPKVIVKYYVAVTGKFGKYGACNRGKCCPRPNTERCHVSVRRRLRVGRRKDGAISFPDEKLADDQVGADPSVARCGPNEALGERGCSWKQLGIAKVITADCLYKVVRGKTENTVMSKYKSVSPEAWKRFEDAFDRSEAHGGCKDLLSDDTQRVPHHVTATAEEKAKMKSWKGDETFAASVGTARRFESAAVQLDMLNKVRSRVKNGGSAAGQGVLQP